MLGICIEASHERGLGHLFRALNLLAYLEERKRSYVLFMNEYDVAARILGERGISHVSVPLSETGSGWEAEVIGRYGITKWVNDRLVTDARHSEAIKRAGLPLVTFDDQGSGAALADLHVAALYFGDAVELPGKKVLAGTRYLILNRDIDRFRRSRMACGRILVTLGGTDTYGATVKVVTLLKKRGLGATVIIGPGFRHQRELERASSPAFVIKGAVPSLPEEFASYDLAFTGGGISAFEAAASGLPTVVVANEWFEVPNARYLESVGCSVFAGHHSQLDDNISLPINNLESMSRAGMAHVTTDGVDHVYREIESV